MTSLIRAAAALIAVSVALLVVRPVPADAAYRKYYGSCVVTASNDMWSDYSNIYSVASTSSNCPNVNVRIRQGGVTWDRHGNQGYVSLQVTGTMTSSDHNWLYAGTWRGFNLACC